MLCNYVTQLAGLMDKVYTTNPHTEKELNENIHTKRNMEVPREELLRVN
jgi:hypothetical protein